MVTADEVSRRKQLPTESGASLSGGGRGHVVDGLDIYSERQGSGAPLLFVNGSGATLATSGMLIAPFAGAFDVVAHDQRGLGRTGLPASWRDAEPGDGGGGDGGGGDAEPGGTERFTMAQYAADCAAVLDAVGWDRCRVVGISFGGMVAQEFAVTFPERVERLALLCTSPGGPDASSYPLHELVGLDPDERAAISTRLLDTRFTEEWLAEHDVDRVIAGFAADRGRAPKSAPETRGEWLQLEARSHHDVVDRLPGITCPTLVASGRFDGIAPPANGALIAELVPDAQLRIYEGGHAFLAQDPAALPEIIGFLQLP